MLWRDVGPMAGMALPAIAGVAGALVLIEGAPGWLVVGAFCWVLGVSVKVPLAGLAELLLTSLRNPPLAASVLAGLNSAASELGVTALALLVWRFPESLATAATVGLGAGPGTRGERRPPLPGPRHPAPA